MKIIIYSIFAVLICLSACSSKSNSQRKPVTNIIITPSNKIVYFENDFSIKIESKIKGSSIEKIELFVDDLLILNTNKDVDSIKISTHKILPGNHTIKTVATTKNKITGINYSSITILSNLKPLFLNYKKIETIYHNNKNFTQGLEFYSNKLYESTGDYGTSYVYEYSTDLKKPSKSLKIEDQYFGEGITILNNKIYQLTYKSKIGFIYDLSSFNKIGEFNFESNEGWGLTNDGIDLIMSDGTSTISYLDPVSLSVKKKIQVTYPEGFIININELEYVDGFIYANIWTTEKIVKFEAETGRVIAFYDMSELKNTINDKSIDVLNGIAYNKNEDMFYITGKLWPSMFKIKFNLK